MRQAVIYTGLDYNSVRKGDRGFLPEPLGLRVSAGPTIYDLRNIREMVAAMQRLKRPQGIKRAQSGFQRRSVHVFTEHPTLREYVDEYGASRPCLHRLIEAPEER